MFEKKKIYKYIICYFYLNLHNSDKMKYCEYLNIVVWFELLLFGLTVVPILHVENKMNFVVF